MGHRVSKVCFYRVEPLRRACAPLDWRRGPRGGRRLNHHGLQLEGGNSSGSKVDLSPLVLPVFCFPENVHPVAHLVLAL